MLFNLWARLSYFLKDFALYLILLVASCILFVFGFFKFYKSDLSPRKKKILSAGIFSLLMIIIAFSFLEAYFRYRYDDSDGLGFLKTNTRWLARHVVYNNFFVRDRNFVENKKEGVTRIGVFGDSLAMGAGIKNPENRFSNLLEGKLLKSGKNVEVYNLGRSGYDFEGEAAFYNDIKHLNFDIVIWEYYLNDIQPDVGSTGAPIIRNVTAPPIVKILSNYSFFFDFLYWRFSSVYQTTITKLKNADLAQYNRPEIFQKHEKEISDFVASIKSENKKFVVIIFPFVHLVGPAYPARQIHQKMENVFADAGADAVIDLLPDLINKNPKDLISSRFDSHPNESVHKLAAEKLFEKVAPLLK